MGISLKNLGIAVSGIPGGANYGLYRELKKGNGYVAPGASNRPPMMASDVRVPGALNGQFGTINDKSQKTLANSLGRLSTDAQTSSMASGRPVGEYQGFALGQANDSASRGIRDSLGGVLGNASLKDAINEQEYQDNIALAKEIGALNKPTMLQQILSLGGSGAEAGAQFKGLYDSLGKKSKSSAPEFGSGRNPYSFDISKLRGYDEPYDYKSNWGSY